MLDSVAPGVYCLDAGRVNLYLCLEEDGLTLIDSGMPRQEKLVWAALVELGRQPSDLKHILITHADIESRRKRGGHSSRNGGDRICRRGNGRLAPKRQVAPTYALADSVCD